MKKKGKVGGREERNKNRKSFLTLLIEKQTDKEKIILNSDNNKQDKNIHCTKKSR